MSHKKSVLKYDPVDQSNYKLSPANFNTYYKAAMEVRELLGRGRLVSLTKKNYATAEKQKNIAHIFVEDNWQTYCEQHGLTYVRDKYYVPETLLTKSGMLPQTYIKALIEHYQNTFDVDDQIPTDINPALIASIIKAPKHVVAEMQINGTGKHNRPCYIVRQLLECEVNSQKYLLMCDQKYYQNSPVVACPLILLRNGYKNGAFIIARPDELGAFDKEELKYFRERYPKLFKDKPKDYPHYPDYLESKFDEIHPNSQNNTTYKWFSVEKTAPQSRHFHVITEDYQLMHTLATMANMVAYHTKPKEYRKYQAKHMDYKDYYVEGSHKHSYSTVEEFYREEHRADFLIAQEIVKNHGIISTERLSTYFSKLYNITNNTPNKRFCGVMDKYRYFIPTRKTDYIEQSQIPPLATTALYVPVSKQNKQELAVKNHLGDYIDQDYINSHPEVLLPEEQAALPNPQQPQSAIKRK